ncbi:hypothetical protein E1B28_004260 [Marasmius oreades]|uniref:Uncharacterized protein n=1 Tax=Marasmius oreades TaxID=181124 RepID=A0A9P8ACR3_9AGAR|nr:uncharacterized protein E1B28_004260 [Marasmius oreades]KAG7096852.1 hypothetical protein E1B28_004260 [Marasmius oreades]
MSLGESIIASTVTAGSPTVLWKKHDRRILGVPIVDRLASYVNSRVSRSSLGCGHVQNLGNSSCSSFISHSPTPSQMEMISKRFGVGVSVEIK